MADLTKYLEAYKPKIDERLGENAAAFRTAVLNVYNGSKQLQECDGRSIMGAAMMSTTLNLPITPSLGQAYIVPYGKQAQLQIGYKGYIQLAHRTGKYTRLHSGVVYEGQVKEIDFATGEIVHGEKISDTVVGYIAYFRLVNGFEKMLYMTREEMEAHAEKYSRSYAYDRRSGKSSSIWTTNFDAMAKKTVLKLLLNKWGVLSVEFQKALRVDSAVIDRNTVTYVDNGGRTEDIDDIYLPEEQPQANEETGEVIETEAVQNEAD